MKTVSRIVIILLFLLAGVSSAFASTTPTMFPQKPLVVNRTKRLCHTENVRTRRHAVKRRMCKTVKITVPKRNPVTTAPIKTTPVTPPPKTNTSAPVITTSLPTAPTGVNTSLNDSSTASTPTALAGATPPANTLSIPNANPVTNPGQAQPAAASPLWFQQAYDLTALSATAGHGQTIAVFNVGDDPTLESELATYRSYYGLPACTLADGCLSIINRQGSNEPTVGGGWAAEADLDVDAISALCPNCHIVYIADSNSDLVGDAQAAKAAGATILSLSATWATSQMPDPGATLTTVEATGDAGAGQAIETPAGYSDDTAVGGTSLVQDVTNPRGWDEYTWSGAGSGCNTTVAKPQFQQGVATGCAGRAYADVSADANPRTGLNIYTSQGWAEGGGTSLSAPLIASYYALMQSQGVNNFSTPAWAYSASALNPITQDFPSGGTLSQIDNYTNQYLQPWTVTPSNYCQTNPGGALCSAQQGWGGQGGMGSISGSLISGAPGVGSNGYVTQDIPSGMTIQGGVYSNDLPTQTWLQFGSSTSYGYSTQATSLPSSNGVAQVTFTVPSTYVRALGVIHYRIVTVNSEGTTYGYDQHFN